MTNSMNDDLVFLDEVDEPTTNLNTKVWYVLVVDDDENARQSTHFALNHVDIMGRPISIIFGDSRKSGLAKFVEHQKDISLCLIDVVMETNTAGLDLINDIREIPAGKNVRLIIRTGQAGYYTDEEVVNNYDINGLVLKPELARAKLINILTFALRDSETIRTLEEEIVRLQRLNNCKGDVP